MTLDQLCLIKELLIWTVKKTTVQTKNEQKELSTEDANWDIPGRKKRLK